MNEHGFVQLPIAEYNRLYEADRKLKELEDTNYGVEISKDYNGKPELHINASNDSMKKAFDKVKDQWPGYEFKYSGDARESVYSAIEPIKSEEEELTL